MLFETYAKYIDISLALNFFILLISLFISYYLAYKTNFVEWFFKDIIVPQFTRINKRYVAFKLYKDQYRSIGLHRYKHAFVFTFLPLVIIFFKSISITILIFLTGEGYGEWDFLGFIVLISPALMLFHGTNLPSLKMGLFLGLVLGGGVYYLNNYKDTFPLSFDTLTSQPYLSELGDYLLEDGKIPVEWYFVIFAGLLLPFTYQLFKSYAGNYNYIKYHRIFQNKSRTTIFGSKVPFPKVLVNKILNFYLWLLPLVMLYSLISIFLGNYNKGGFLVKYLDKDDPLQQMLFLNGFTFLVFVNIGLVVLPLTKGMFQYKIFKVLGNFQDVVEKEKSDENIIKGYMNYLNELGEVSDAGDLIMFVLIFDSILGFFVKFGDFFSFVLLSRSDVLLLSSILKIELYGSILLSILFYREEKKGTDFFDMIQESFKGRYIDLKFFRLGRIAKFDKKKYLKMDKDTPKDEVLLNIRILMETYKYKDALKLSKRLLKREGEDLEIYTLMLRCYDFLGMNKDFKNLMKKLLKKEGKDNPDLLFLNGRFLFYLQEFKKAMESFQHCLKVEPNSEKALFYLGRCYLELGEHEKAIPYFERIYKLNPKNFENLYYYGFVKLLGEKYAESVHLLREAMALDINHLNVWELLGDNYLHLGKEKEANQCFALVVESEHENLYLTKARAYQIAGKEAEFEKFVKKAEEDITEHIYSAMLHFKYSPLFHRIKNLFLNQQPFKDESGVVVNGQELASSPSYLQLKSLLTEGVKRKEKKRILKKYSLKKRANAFRELGFGFVHLGDVAFLKGQPGVSLFFYRAAERVYLREKELKFRDLTGFEDLAYRRIGDVLSHFGYYQEAVEAHLLSLEINGDQPIEYFKTGLNFYLSSFEKRFPLQQASAVDQAIGHFTLATKSVFNNLKSPYARFIYVLSSYFKTKCLEIIGGFEKANTFLVEVSKTLKTYNTLWLALAESYINYEKEVWDRDQEGGYILKYTTDKGRYYREAKEVLKKVLEIDPRNEEAKVLMRVIGDG